MTQSFYEKLLDENYCRHNLNAEIAEKILLSEEVELLPLLNTAFQIRKKYIGKKVSIHIINNIKNGNCSQDCQYCAQSKSSKANIEKYKQKSEEEILAEAKLAYKRGAFRYCMVSSGYSTKDEDIECLVKIIKKIKKEYPLEVCVSLGVLNENKARILKEAGLNRFNHNINTSPSYYPKICSTHTFEERLNTLRSAKAADLQICSGVIVGMGEGVDDIYMVAEALREFHPESIPVNFFLPLKGLSISKVPDLTPEFCLRVLCLFRFMHPKADIRIAAGREVYLRNMEVLSLYPANSLFLNGYLNAEGSSDMKTLQMIRDAGFEVDTTIDVDNILSKHNEKEVPLIIKGQKELHPTV